MPESARKNPAGGTGRSYGRWRAASLLAVYLLMGLHIAHWKVRGSTIAPLELNEVMYTLELGILTAGFFLMVGASLSVLVFGRFFCSWACHILALEDLAAWLLGKVGIRPKPIRSRLLAYVAPGALLYMFVWPQLQRLFAGEELPALHLRMDGDGWASFVTSDFWRNLPGPGIALLTFGVCGFLIVYLLGTRAFCTYVCPYGAAFALADRFAPGRIRERHLGACIGCAKCTAVCSSDVRVHEEILLHGQVTDSNCLKDLDCVSICPEDAITFGFTRPKSTWKTFFARWTAPPDRVVRARTGQRIVGKRYDFTWWEEVGAGVLFLVSAWILRGLYGRVPFLLALGSAVIVAVLGVVSVRLLRRPIVRLSHLSLKRDRLTRSGALFIFGALAVAAFLVHSGWIRVHELLGERAYASMESHIERSGTNPPPALLESASRHAEFVKGWGLIRSPETYLRLASIYSFEDPPLRAIEPFEKALEKRPEDHAARLRYASVLRRLGRVDDARAELEAVVASRDVNEYQESGQEEAKARAYVQLGRIALAEGDRSGAEAAYIEAIACQPDLVDAYVALAMFYRDLGQEDATEAVIERGLEHVPNDSVLLRLRTRRHMP